MKRFNNMIELAEVQGGLIMLKVLAEKENDYQSNNDEDLQKCSCDNELNNMHLSNNCDYPKSMEIMNDVNHPMKE